MRIAVPAFGPVALAALRVAGAALLLVPLLAARGELGALRRHWRPIARRRPDQLRAAVRLLRLCGAHRSTPACSPIFNSASPLFAAVIAWLWLGDRHDAARASPAWRSASPACVWIAWDQRRAARPAAHAAGPSSRASSATLCYGVSPSVTKRHLTGVPPLAVAAGSQLVGHAAAGRAGAAGLAGRGADARRVLAAAAALAFVCTGLAYILYFRLIAHAGPANAIAVTYLIPIFAVLWGGLFLGERDHAAAASLGCAVIFARHRARDRLLRCAAAHTVTIVTG